jgi:hypothetical protein
MHIYDYLFAGVIIIALLLGSTVMMAMLSSPALNASEKDLLKIASEKIMTQMLLDPGYPYNWGSANTPQQNMAVFGLARYGETSREAYLLDPDKVLRLNSTLEGGASYYFPASAASSLPEFENYTALSLLNLRRDYGFTLEFNETLKVSVNQIGEMTDIYSISVASDYALPMLGANVSATLYYVNSSTLLIDHLEPKYNATIYDGSCILYLNGSSTGEAKVLVVGVDYYGVHTAKLYGNVGTSVLNATLFGSTLIPSSSQPYNITNGAAHEITLLQTTLGYETKDFEVENSGTPTNFTLNSAPEPSTVAILAVSENNKLLVGSRDFSMISYRTIPAIRSAASAYSLERTVLIGGVTFTATLYFWRMSS